MEFTIELEGFCWKRQGRNRRFNPFSFFTPLPRPPISTSTFREAVFIRLKVAEKKTANLFLPVLILREVATPDVVWENKKFGSTPPSFREVEMILCFAGSPCPTRAWNLLCENFKNGMNGFSRNWEFPINQLVTWLILKFVLPHTRKWRWRTMRSQPWENRLSGNFWRRLKLKIISWKKWEVSWLWTRLHSIPRKWQTGWENELQNWYVLISLLTLYVLSMNYSCFLGDKSGALRLDEK